MFWTGRADEVTALGLLLDRTYAGCAAAAAQPRLLDRGLLTGQLDLWDEHLVPAVAAAADPLRTRRAAARTVWHSLGCRAGAAHRRWMAGHLADLGLDADALLGPERDRTGRLPVRPADLMPDLAGGIVEEARMEVSGADPVRLHADLRLSAASTRHADDVASPSELSIHSPEVSSFRFAHAERGAVRLTGQPVVSGQDEVTVTVPATGADLGLTGRDLTRSTSDSGRYGTATREGTGDDGPGLPPSRELPGSAGTLVALQLTIVRRLRTMGDAERLRRRELAAAGTLCAGLGADLFRPGPAVLRERTAGRRLRAMVTTTDAPARDLLRQVGPGLRLDGPERPGEAPPAPVRITVGTAGPLTDELAVTGARLRLATVGADRTVLHLDARRAGQDTIVVIVLTEPLGCAPLTVSPGGLDLTGRPVLAATADDIVLTIPLPDGDWTVRATAGSWYVD